MEEKARKASGFQFYCATSTAARRFGIPIAPVVVTSTATKQQQQSRGLRKPDSRFFLSELC